jgi:hypothetical protein
VNDLPASPQTELADLAQAEQSQLVTREQIARKENRREFALAAVIALAAALVFYVSTKPIFQHLDYTARIALALINGHLGVQTPPPAELNEMIPFDGRYYSIFPLGAVLSVLPVALLQKAGWLHNFPGRAVAALIAGVCAFFFFRLSSLEVRPLAKRFLLALFPIFGTWLWCNLGFGAAWQVSLGFALVGELGALYFTLLRPRPLVAGAFFALAFGNRTELILTLPVFLYFVWRPSTVAGQALRTPSLDNPESIRDCSTTSAAVSHSDDVDDAAARGDPKVATRKRWLWENWRPITDFLVLPLTLALLTTAYNYARFGSFFDFGYARIPNVLHEPWYKHGLFSVHAIPWNVTKMFFEGLGDRPDFPFLRLYPFGCSIFLSSPFLCLIFRQDGRYRRACWLIILLLTLVLCMQANPEGWQFGYRYATILLPWMFLLIAGNGPSKISLIEISLFVVSVAINALATWQFLWTSEVHP